MRYLVEALMAGVPLGGVRLPLNPLFLLAVVAAGFLHPAVWVAGFGLEALFLIGLVSNARFRRAVDAKWAAEARPPVDLNNDKQRLIRRLHPDLRIRLGHLQKLLARARQIVDTHLRDDLAAPARFSAAEQIEWLFLKLLLAQENLAQGSAGAGVAALEGDVRRLEAEVAQAAGSDDLRRSREGALRLARERLAAAQLREERLREVDCELERLEAEVALALERQSLDADTVLAPGAKAREIWKDASVYGESAPAVEAVERALQQEMPRA